MALIECPDCGHKVSDSAASCPGCGAIRKAYNELNWPAFHITAVGMLVALTVPSLSTMPPLARLLGMVALALVVSVLGWGIPAVAESRRLRREQRIGKPEPGKPAEE